MMLILSPAALFYSSILLYLIAAVTAVILYRQPRLNTFLTQSISIVASLFCGWAAGYRLLSGTGDIILKPFRETIPFLSFHLKIDGLSALFLIVLSILAICVSVYSMGYLSHYRGKYSIGMFNMLYALFLLSMMLVFTANHAILFFMVWEIMAIVSYFLVVYESDRNDVRQAGLLYIIMTHLGSAFLMIAFMIMFYYTHSFELSSSGDAIPETTKNILFFLFLIGFGTKAGVIPLHIWLPYAHPAAPGNISALMSGIMIKTAVYGLIRFLLIDLGSGPAWWGTIVLIIGIISAVFGVLYAYVEQNTKKMLAYSSIENMGIIFMGLGISLLAFSKNAIPLGALALTAALLHSMNHALFKGGLFLGVGSVDYATHTKNLEELGGLIKSMPLTAVLFLGSALSASAVVPFNGFIGEWMTYQSLFAGFSLEETGLNIIMLLGAALLALAGALAAACFIKLFGIAFLGLPRSTSASQAREVPFVMNIGTSIPVVLCLVVGVFPVVFLKLTDQAVSEVAGFAILPLLQGNLVLLTYPLKIAVHGQMITPLTVFILMLCITVTVMLFLAAVRGKHTVKKYGTWDCGYAGLNERMQYSGTAFSKPVKIVFKLFFKSSRNLNRPGDSIYHPDSIEYKVTTESIFEKYFYIPLLAWATKWSGKIKFMVQTGSVHTYLLYIFIAVLLLMFYNRIT